MKLLMPPEYVSQAAAAVRKAEKRVLLLSLVIADHPATHELISELEAAAKRGLKVSVAADIFTYGEVTGSFLPLRYNSPNAKLATKMGKTLKAAGVKFHWLGRGRISLITGRTHSKWCVVDDTSFVFGGVNMYQAGIENNDYMFRVENTKLADRLGYEQERIRKADRASTNYPSVSYELDGNSVLIDGGIIGQSIIHRRACELSLEAEEILFVSQYCPTGKLSRILRTKKAEFYFNRPEQANIVNRFLIKMSILTTGLQTLYKKQHYLHAKYILFKMSDGRTIALTGSHNFAYTGVLLGTREIALETSDPKIIDQLLDFHEKYVA